MDIKILQGDSLNVLRTLPSESINCCVTSPPYWGLRDYGCEGQIGLEHSLGEHIAVLVGIFNEVKRVLRHDGTLWMNYGDAYASAPNGRSAADTKAAGNDDRTFRDKPISTVGPIIIQRPGDDARGANGKESYRPGHTSRIAAGGTLKPKDRMLLPARVAIALQDSGWWVRDEIIWHKPNPMPSSVKDRTTPAHEMIYMLSKNPKYYYDSDAIKEPSIYAPGATKEVERVKGYYGGKWSGRNKQQQQQTADNSNAATQRTMGGFNARWDARRNDGSFKAIREFRNKRSVWTIPPKGFKEAHFATFPPDLIRPCILAGCPFGGTVLDPFFGAGTTGLVANELGRNTVGVELSSEYISIAKRRLGIFTDMPWESVDFPWK